MKIWNSLLGFVRDKEAERAVDGREIQVPQRSLPRCEFGGDPFHGALRSAKVVLCDSPISASTVENRKEREARYSR